MNSPERRGVLFGIAAYSLWGIFPLYFRLLDDSGPVEILVHRILWSLLACLLVVLVIRAGGQVRAVSGNRPALLRLAVAAVAIAVNWGIYIYAVNSGQVVEAALGYFINPVVTVALGVLVLREHLRPLQWTAVGIGFAAVLVLTAGYGRLPWIALSLAITFGTYSLLKKQVGAAVGALAGLTTETLVLAPVALVVLIWLEATGRGSFTDNPPWQGLLLASAGFVTISPLLLFAASARRVPLTMVGLLQYITPVLQLLCGVLLLGEQVPATRWIGFGLVWAALLLLAVDSIAEQRRYRQGLAQIEEVAVPACVEPVTPADRQPSRLPTR